MNGPMPSAPVSAFDPQPVSSARSAQICTWLAAPLWSPWSWAVLALLAVASALIVPQYSHDSMFYADMAQGIVAGRGPSSYYLDLLSYAIPNPRQSWPPGYPLL